MDEIELTLPILLSVFLLVCTIYLLSTVRLFSAQVA